MLPSHTPEVMSLELHQPSALLFGSAPHLPGSRDTVQHREQRGTLQAEPCSRRGAWTVLGCGLAPRLGVQLCSQNGVGVGVG